MGKKLFYLITVLPFYLFTFLPLPAGAKAGFPVKGGTTSDGITITEPKLKHFVLVDDGYSYKIEGNSTKNYIKFNVTVPKGQEASLRYKFFLELAPSIAGGAILGGSSVTFSAKIDQVSVKTHPSSTSLCYQADEINISEGKHEVSLEARFDARDCIFTGGIDSLSIHIHNFSIKKLAKEPLCGEKGLNRYTCDVCYKEIVDSVFSKHPDHLWKEYPGQKSSCMNNVGKIMKCEYCAKTDIIHDGKMRNHDFDDSGTCRLCGLHKPKCNADGSVYEINDASEMRVLSELVSIGEISGNIGVDIKSDLVFTPDMPMMPLGSMDRPFQGVLNGNGHRIRGVLNCFRGVDCLGFVGVAKGTAMSHAVIANLIFDGENSLTGTACVGGIVAYATNCDILNCASFGSLEGNNYVGGIVGYADQQVSIHNCASASTIKTVGKWNPMACGLPLGHVLNSYGASTNDKGGSLDELSTATLRHCFSTHGNAEGVTLISWDMLSSYNMLQLLTEESQEPCFMMSQNDPYPIPVVNTSISAKANTALEAPMRASVHRAASLRASEDDFASEKDYEIEVIGGYVDENSPTQYDYSIEEIMHEDSIQYPDLNCLYVITRSVPEGFLPYERISGGNVLGFESYIIPDDSAYVKMREYNFVSADKVRAVAETVYEHSGPNEQINEYIIENGNSSLKSRILFENTYDIIYQESINGVMKTIWSIKTDYDNSGKATSTNVYSHNYTTGEMFLEYSYTYKNGEDVGTEDENYTEYEDSETNTIHVIYTYPDTDPGEPILRDHYILRGSDQALLETREEEMIGNDAYFIDGMYFIYDDEGALVQGVAFGPVKGKNVIGPYMYYDYVGRWPASPFPTTAIQVPTVNHPSLEKRMDSNIYDMQGRVVSRVTDTQDPFSGLPRGIYIYQGTKYLKR